eukprot:gene12033-13275_t
MSATFDQRTKDNGQNSSGPVRKGDAGKGYGYNPGSIQSANPLPQQPEVRAANMPETFVSGYYPNTNSAYPISYNFGQQPAWSTGTNVNSQPQGYDTVPNYAFGTLPPGGGTDSQYMTQDQLFNPSNSAFNQFQPYMNGNGGWSYFNNASSFFFPTGNTDLNLQFGSAEGNLNAPLHQDLYKPPPPPEHEKAVVESGELNTLENGDIDPNAVEKALSKLTVSGNQVEKDISDPSVSSSVSVSNKGNKSSSTNVQSGTSNAPAKPASWAAVASQPAKPKPPQSKSQKAPIQLPPASKSNYPSQNGSSGRSTGGGKQQQGASSSGRLNRQNVSGQTESSAGDSAMPKDSSKLLRELWAKNNFNPKELSLDFKNARFFIIKSYSEDDIFRSIKYSIWTSTEHGNRRLNEAYKEQQKSGGGPIYMLFSVNGSGHFCGIATMMSSVDIHVETGVWVQDKWKGRFDVKWIYVKDVPNSHLRHIRLENNENKPITNSRDTQEVPLEKGKQVIKLLHGFKAQTSIFDDFSHYEQRQEEDAKIRQGSELSRKMVYAFIVQSLSSSSGETKEPSEVLHSEVYGAGLNVKAPSHEQREICQQQIYLISQRINSEFAFRKASNTPIDSYSTERLPKNKPLPVEKHVIWQAMGNFGFSMVLSPDENKAVAENVLSLVVRSFMKIFKNVEGFEEIKTSPDKVSTILHTYLPNGQRFMRTFQSRKKYDQRYTQTQGRSFCSRSSVIWQKPRIDHCVLNTLNITTMDNRVNFEPDEYASSKEKQTDRKVADLAQLFESKIKDQKTAMFILFSCVRRKKRGTRYRKDKF